MKDLELKILPVKAVWVGLSILLILNGCMEFISHLGALNIFNVSYSLIAMAAGIYFLSGKSEIDKVSVRLREESILINWQGWLKRKELNLNEIMAIYLRRSEVMIILKGLKVIKLSLNALEVKQKEQVYIFFIRCFQKQPL